MLFRAVFSLPGHSLPFLYTDLCLLRPWSRAFFFVLRALRKCSCHDWDSPSMLDPPPMIEFLELHACSVRIKGRHALKWGTCSNSNTEQQYSTYTVARQRTSVSFKLAVRGDSGAGGLVAPLPCTAYFGKLAILFGCSLPQQVLA